MQNAIFAAGCFWGVEAAFAALAGVIETEVGYTGGTTDNPTYESVCANDTGHAEAVRVMFDPAKISYAELVKKFFDLHDPTQLNRQGPDFGDQYRSAIFYTTAEQKQTALQVRERVNMSGRHKKSIVTVVEPAKHFWPAEDYHQKYLAKKGGGVCHI
jgi:peptide-methionine (S)-S-oxide reductase